MHRKRAISRPAASVTVLLVLLSLDAARAQQPSQEEISAIRSSCRSDFMANCSGVTPGGKDALECLKRNVAKLSGSCKTAVSAITPAAPPAAPAPAHAPAPAPAAAAPAPAATPAAKSESAPAEPAIRSTASQEELKAVQKACTLNDLVAHCSSIAPSSPEILPCLKSNAAKLSPGCQAALGTPATAAKPAAAPAKQPAAAARTVTPPTAPPAAATAPAKPTEAQTAAIRSACRSDFMSQCAGVQPGGADALQCLQHNAAKLSASCKSAVAAIGGGAPARRTCGSR